MNDKQIISQLKGLKSIKPGKDWALLVKKDLLSEPINLHEKQEKISFGEAIFAFFAKPSFVVSSLIFVGVAIFGTLAYFDLQKKNYDLQAYINSFSQDNEENKEAVAGLADIQNKMEEVKTALVALKSSNDPKQVLAAAEVVKATAKNSQTAVEQIKKSGSELSRETLASLSKIEDASVELEKTSADLQIEMFKNYLAELKARTLSEGDQERLAKAEKYFEDGKVDEAILLLVKIGETLK